MTRRELLESPMYWFETVNIAFYRLLIEKQKEKSKRKIKLKMTHLHFPRHVKNMDLIKNC